MIEPRLLDGSKLKPINISNEEYRVYKFEGGTVRVEGGAWLFITDTEHRILDNSDFCHHIPYGWLSLKYKVKKDFPHFVF